MDSVMSCSCRSPCIWCCKNTRAYDQSVVASTGFSICCLICTHTVQHTTTSVFGRSLSSLCLCSVFVHCVCAVCLYLVSVYCVYVVCQCTVSVQCVFATYLCNVFVQVVHAGSSSRMAADNVTGCLPDVWQFCEPISTGDGTGLMCPSVAYRRPVQPMANTLVQVQPSSLVNSSVNVQAQSVE